MVKTENGGVTVPFDKTRKSFLPLAAALAAGLLLLGGCGRKPVYVGVRGGPL